MDGYYSDSVITGNEGKKRKRKNRRKSSGSDSDSQSNKQYKPDARLSSSICDAISEANSVLYENSPVSENSPVTENSPVNRSESEFVLVSAEQLKEKGTQRESSENMATSDPQSSSLKEIN